MGKKQTKQSRPGFKDLVTLASAGWTPGQVNELLDRFDALGDLNAPEEVDNPEDVEDEDIDVDVEDQDEPDEDEDDNVSDEDEEEDTSNDTGNKKKDTNKLSSIEVENQRLKKQIQKLQQKNRTKDISGGKDEKPIEKSLIDTFQSIFD